MEQKFSGLLTSGVLAVVTLSVFAAAQSSGPESTVRRYLRALQDNNATTLQDALTQPANSPYSIWLAQHTFRLTSNMRLQGKERAGETTLVATEHTIQVPGIPTPQTVVASRVWILVRRQGKWKIDPERTFRYFQESMRRLP